MRVTKDSEERRNELIEAAEKLFSENGFANTAVSAIVKEVNVAQGLFYYYFKSKDDVIEAISEKYTREFKRILEDGFQEVKGTSVEDDINTFIQNAILSFVELWDKFRDQDEKQLYRLSYISVDEAKKTASDALQKILERANEEEWLKVTYPEQFAKVIVSGICDLVQQGELEIAAIKDVIDEMIRSQRR
ncbi:MAG: TetR/AcrR family transcriptional regulator [Erysipelotrichaceae bacterium]|nr:TetR/AcrR family transcriptional regulator [Erysipelotrichaceae bacterium]